jgi:transposase
MTDHPGCWYTMPAVQRDETIIALRRRGLTHKQIAKRVGMSESGVTRALERIRMGGFGQGMTRG